MKIKITFVLVGMVAAIVFSSAGSVRAATWTQKADMPTPRWGHSVAVVNGKIYVIGGVTSETGFLNGQPISAVEEYNPATDTWTRKADMPEPRGYLYGSHPVIDGRIYVIGGGKSAVSRVDVYDPATDTWSRAADMPTPRILMARVTWDGKIYAFGGKTGTLGSSAPTVNVTEVYDPKTDTWAQAAPMPTRVWEHSACVVEDKIYVIGGATATNSIQIFQVYDPMTDTWTNVTPKPLNTRGFGATAVCGKIYAVGGWLNSGQRPYSETWVYDPFMDTWTAGVSLPDFRAALTISMVNGKIYAIGGTPKSHNCQATSTVYELEVELDFPPPDFNGDGIVDSVDMCMMIDYWGTDELLYDIVPACFGDGIVDFRDLAVLTEYWLKDFRLIAHWKLDETEGSIAYDSIGSNDGTLNGDPNWQPAGGQVDGALEFNGSNNYINTDFVLNPVSGSFSVFAWIKGGEPGQVIICQTDGTQGSAWLCAESSEGKLRTNLMDAFFPSLESESIITDGQWHHIGLVYDLDVYHRHLYVDGIEVAKDTSIVGGLSSTAGMHIGADKALEEGSFFSGMIDDVRIYNVALSAKEIEEMLR
ncbi:MAG: Kelch repeat-containing protein [Planctomycetota bacterium]